MNEHVLVIGGTRGTGWRIAGLLLKQGYRVRALARDEGHAKTLLSSAIDVVGGDITRPDTLPSAMRDIDHIVFTAGVTKRPAGEGLIIETVFEGVKNTLAAAREGGVEGRFLYMTAIGVTSRSPGAALLNLVKRNTLHWRRRAEDAIRASGLAYTIVRAGILTNAPGGRRAIDVSQNDYPLALKYRIGRADVAEAIVMALKYPNLRWTTFEVVWGRGVERESWDVLFGRLRPDD